MNDHPSHEELEALSQGRLSRERARYAMGHLLWGCVQCIRKVQPPLSVLLGLQHQESAEERDAAYEVAMERASTAIQLHQRYVSPKRTQARRALAELEAGGLETAEKVARKTKGLALYEALLARSWALRHENPGLMVQLTLLATQVAEKLEVRLLTAVRKRGILAVKPRF